MQELCRDFDIEAANFNAPGQIIVSGEKTKVAAAVAAAKDRGIKKVMPLNVAGAYHSRLMEPARTAFTAFLESVPFDGPALRRLHQHHGRRHFRPRRDQGGAGAAGRIIGAVGRLHAERRRGRRDGVLGTRAGWGARWPGSAHRKNMDCEEFL